MIDDGSFDLPAKEYFHSRPPFSRVLFRENSSLLDSETQYAYAFMHCTFFCEQGEENNMTGPNDSLQWGLRVCLSRNNHV